MVAALAVRLGVGLAPRILSLGDGSQVAVDAVSDDLAILCEAWAHQGPPKSAQRNKVLADALKLAIIARSLPHPARLILLFSDEAAALPFRGQGWPAHALREFRIEIQVVELPETIRSSVLRAQTRQFR